MNRRDLMGTNPSDFIVLLIRRALPVVAGSPIRSSSAAVLMASMPRVREQVPELMHGTSLYRDAIPDGGKRLLQPRRAVDDEKLRSAQAALDRFRSASKYLM
jgi:hypothetical protein